MSKIRWTVAGEVMLQYEGSSRALRKWISMPSLSWAVQIGVMAAKAAEVSRHERPAIDPESSIKKIVSKVVRNAYGLSVDGAKDVAGAVYEGGASSDGVANGFSTVGGFAGRLVGALKAAKCDFGADRLDEFDMVDGVLPRPEFLRLFLLKILREGIFLECMVFGDVAHSEEPELSSMNGIVN